MKSSFKFIVLIVLSFSSLNFAYADGVEELSALSIIDSLKSNGYLEHAEVLSDIVDVREKTCAEKVDYDAAEYIITKDKNLKLIIDKVVEEQNEYLDNPLGRDYIIRGYIESREYINDLKQKYSCGDFL
ncbi:hypothetical protein PTR77_18640 [Serratia bockelmannii]|uniref:hypothetical protein n=1 Tax=Serratia bockelmannii TaxID=2703793 RepID=UPI00313AEC4A